MTQPPDPPEAEASSATPAAAPRWQASQSVRALRELTRLAARVHHTVARRTGLSSADLSALDLLSRAVMGPAELARSLDLTTAAATGIVDRLETRGHAERQPIPGDRRRTGVHITASGRVEAHRHLMPMFLGLQANDEAFTQEEREVVRRYLEGAVEAMQTMLDEPEEQS